MEPDKRRHPQQIFAIEIVINMTISDSASAENETSSPSPIHPGEG